MDGYFIALNKKYNPDKMSLKIIKKVLKSLGISLEKQLKKAILSFLSIFPLYQNYTVRGKTLHAI
jgi:hypothetical protein